jgi:MEKHLA domain
VDAAGLGLTPAFYRTTRSIWGRPQDDSLIVTSNAEDSRSAAPLEPSEANGYLAAHVRMLRDSLRRWTGRELIPPQVPEHEAGRWLYEAPIAVLSHSAAAEPLFTYGNRTALALFEVTWQELTALPSKLSAEPVSRQERARLLQEVSEKGAIEHYAGVRISSTGKRFRIRNAIVWNLVDEAGEYRGQAAMFSEWEPL